MKYTYLLILALLLSACGNKPDRIEIEGKAPSLKSGVFGIVDVLNKPVYGENIVDGKFTIGQVLEYPGYYMVRVTNMFDTKAKHIPYEVYLENGKYTFEINSDLTKYPKVTSPSKIQEELSAYYTLYDEMVAGINKQEKELAAYLQSDAGRNQRADIYLKKVDELKALRAKQDAIVAEVVEKFIQKYPQTKIAPHLMVNLDYKSDPVRFYELFSKLTAEAKNTEEGKELGAKLAGLVKLVPGQTAPDIAGTDPDGKPFDRASLKKKIILIDFWRAGNQVSRENHQLMRDNLFFEVNNNRDFAIISINLDDKKDWWTGAIGEDKMKWLQYSDLKGNNSKNAETWGISRVPTYYLVDGNWKILKREIAYDDVSYEITRYLDKH